MFSIYRKLKGLLNYLLGRIIDFSDMVLMDCYSFPWSIIQTKIQSAARFIGNICFYIQRFPRLSVYRLVGTDWSIIFVGEESGLREIGYLLFKGDVDEQDLGRVAIWQLSRKTEQWLDQGNDLVICELSNTNLIKPKAPLSFKLPTWINHEIIITEPFEDMFSGKRFKPLRNRLNKAKRACFDFSFSKSKLDFDHFYNYMYVPFIQRRHKELAKVPSYLDQWQRWFSRGGLILITQENKSVAGAICYFRNNTFFMVSEGILTVKEYLMKQEINAFLVWSALNFAYESGALKLDIGGTRPWRSKGSFSFKEEWGARVSRRKRIYGTWMFLAKDLPPPLQDHINELRFICEVDNRFCSLSIVNNESFDSISDYDQLVSNAKKHGLDGVALVSGESSKALYCL